MSKLDKIMNPTSVAIIGASATPGSVGNELLCRMLEFGYRGKLYGVHPKLTKIMDIPTYPHIYDIPDTIDLAVIAVPAKIVLNIIEDCHQANVRDLVIISSGFKEIGGEGTELEKALLQKVRQYNMNLVGPNCLGVINSHPNISMDASFAPLTPTNGNIGFATQSGALASGIINILPNLGIGLGQVISLGNQADITALEVLEHWEQDNNITQILLYLESITNPDKFREIATRISRKKPILAIKSGRSSIGALATSSHTGSLAGDDSTANSLLASSGIIREYYLRDLFSTAQVLDKCPLPRGKNLAILTNAGGPGIIATDTATEYGLNMATLTHTTKAKLRDALPPQASTRNPVDMIASAPAEHYLTCGDILLSAPEVDMLLVIYLYITGKNDIQVTANLNELKAKYPDKPIVAVYMTTPDFTGRVQTELPNSTIPVFDYTVDALHGLSRLAQRSEYLNSVNTPTPIFATNKSVVADILSNAHHNGVTTLSVFDSLNVFANYGLPVPKFGIATQLSQAIKVANKIGYPLVMKISSTQITHKTDIGGVIVGIQNKEMLAEKWTELTTRLQNKGILNNIDGIVLMQQISGSGRELVCGMIKSNNNPPLMMFGMGGIFIEALKEVAFRPCPLTTLDANTLIDSTKAKSIIGNLRGLQACDRDKLTEILLRLSQLVMDHPIISELDANPIMLDKSGTIYAVDARIVIK